MEHTKYKLNLLLQKDVARYYSFVLKIWVPNKLQLNAWDVYRV